MKNAFIISFVTYLMLVSVSVVNSQQSITDEQKDTKTAIEGYINALIEGNTEIIKESLGGDLLNKRSKILDNPDYARLLRDTYENASFAIKNCKKIDMDKVQADVIIFLKGGEIRKVSFLLIRETSGTDTNGRFLIHRQIVD